MVLLVPAVTAVSPSFQKDYAIPFDDLHIILARVAAISSFCLTLIILTLPVPFCVSTFGDIEFSQVLCGYFGIILYTITGIATSAFLFIICNHVVLAFTFSILFFLFINNAHLIAAFVKLPEWIIAFCKELSFEWHFNACSKGIIDSRDLLFYMAFCILSIFASVIVMQYKRGFRNLLLKRFILLGASAFVLILLNSSRYFFRVDTTLSKKFTVSPYSKVLLSEVKEPLKITYYLSPVLKNLYPQVKDVDDFLQDYATVSDNVFYEQKEPVEQILLAQGIQGEQIQTASDSATSYTTVYSAVVIQCLDSTEIIPFVLDTKRLEYDLTSRIQYIIRGIARNVQIVIGNGLSLEEDYSYVKPWLESQGFSVLRTYFPSQAGIGRTIFFQIPEVPVLVLGTSECTLEDADALSYFLQNGGKLFIATEPYTIDVKKDWAVSENKGIIKDYVTYMLQQYGIYFAESMTADTACLPLSLSSSYDVKSIQYPLWPVLKKQKNALNGMSLFWPCSIETDADVASESEFDVFSVLHTTQSAWLYSIEAGTNPFGIEKTLPDQSAYKKLDVCVELSKRGNSKCIILADQYCFDTNMIAFSSSGKSIDDRGLDFLTDSLLKLCGQSELLALKNKSNINTSLYKIDAMSVKGIVFMVIIVPVLFMLICGICANIQRYLFNRENYS